MAKIIDKKGQKSLLIKFSSTHSLCLFTLTQILYLIIKFQISRTIVTSICYGGSKLPNYFYSTLLRSCVNIEFYEKRGPKQTLNCILLSRPWSSGMDYFKNNKQNLSSHLKLVILENNRLLLENNGLFVKITSKK